MKNFTIATALIAFAGAALAHTGVKDPKVLARMEAMKEMGGEVKVLGQMAKGTSTFDKDRAQAALDRIALLAKDTPALFQTRALEPMSEALPLIWEEFDTFVEEAQALETLAQKLVISDNGDLVPALGQLGEGCRSCHGQFRQ
jgi:cytochrome c556